MAVKEHKVTGRGTISPELAKKYYGKSKSGTVVSRAKKRRKAEAVVEAEKTIHPEKVKVGEGKVVYYTGGRKVIGTGKVESTKVEPYTDPATGAKYSVSPEKISALESQLVKKVKPVMVTRIREDFLPERNIFRERALSKLSPTEIEQLAKPTYTASFLESRRPEMEQAVRWQPRDPLSLAPAVFGKVGTWGIETTAAVTGTAEMWLRTAQWKFSGDVLNEAISKYMGAGKSDIRFETITGLGRYPVATTAPTSPTVLGYMAGETVRETVKYAKEKPGEFIGKTAVSFALWKGVEKAGGLLPKVKIVRTGGYRGIAVEYGGKVSPKSKVLFGFKGKKPVLGTPEIDLTKIKIPSQGAVAQSPAETKIWLKSIKTQMPDETYAFIKSYVEGSRLTATQKSAFVRQLSGGTKTLSPKSINEVLKFIRKERGVGYGSYFAKSQMKKGVMGRQPGDIDVQLLYSQEKAALKAQSLAKKLAKIETGGKVRVSPSKPTLIEVYKGNKWHHAVDIHSLDQSIQDMMTPTLEGAWGFKFQQKPITLKSDIGKIKGMRLSEHGLRKGASSTILRKISDQYKYGVGPELHRMKDIGDYMTTQQILIESQSKGLGGLLRRGRVTKATSYLANFEKSASKMFGISPSKVVKLPIYQYAAGPNISASIFTATSIPAIGTSLTPSSMTKYTIPSVRVTSLASISSKIPKSISNVSSISRSTYTPSSISKSLSKSISPSISPSKSSISYRSYLPSVSKSTSRSVSKSLSKSLNQLSRSLSVSTSKYKTKMKPPSILPPPSVRGLPGIGKKKKKKPGYDVFTKIYGKKVKIATNITKNSALSRGAAYVDRTPAASFTIKKSGKKAKGADVFGWKAISHKFRKRKTKNALRIVEKAKYRADDIGEIMGLKKAKRGKRK